tara:strand:- start:280 stop:1305 length:1026 start_codon:yes stop_codon:yes gene_type:complete
MSQLIRFVNFASADSIKLNIQIVPAKPDSVFKVNSFSHSFTKNPVSNFHIKFNIDFLLSDLNILIPENQKDDFFQNTKLVIKYVCKVSRKTGLIDLEKIKNLDESKGIYCYQAEKDFVADDFDGYIEFICLLVRTQQAPLEKGYLTEQSSILGESQSRILHIEPYEEADQGNGNQLEVITGQIEHVGREDVGFLNVLYQFNSDTLTIILNEKSPKATLKALEHVYSNDAESKKLQDAIFSPIILSVWEQLAREAFAEMTDNSEGIPLDTSELSFPLNKVAETIAKTLYKGVNNNDAKEWLATMLSEEESKRHLIDKLVPLAVQEIAGLQDAYEPVSEKFKY